MRNYVSGISVGVLAAFSLAQGQENATQSPRDQNLKGVNGEATAPGQPSISRLRCEYRINPMGIDAPNPRLSWVINSDRREERQTAYWIQIASSAEKLRKGQSDLWDSGKWNGPWWGGSAVWLPWELYQRTGDDRLLRESYAGMKRYVAYIGTMAENGVHDWALDDWLAPEVTPRAIINTPAAFLYARIISRAADLLGKRDDAAHYAQMAKEICDTYNARFLDVTTGIYGIPGGAWTVPDLMKNQYPKLSHEIWWTGDRPCTQAGQVMPLALGMVPESVRPKVEQALVREIAAHGNHLSTGFVSTPYLLQVLADVAPDLGLAITAQRDFPSWYGMTKGAGRDLLAEQWTGGYAAMPSCGGQIAAWHMEAIAGIRPDPIKPGFKRILIKPTAIKGLTWAKGWYDSPYGRIASAWTNDGKIFTLDITVPANTTATVWVPAKNPTLVSEGAKATEQSNNLKYLRMENGAAVYEVASGTYHFNSMLGNQ